MRHFRVRRGQIVMSFKPFEADLLIEFFGQVRALLLERAAEVGQSSAYAEDPGDDTALLAALESSMRPVPPPTDAVLARLLPSGRRDVAPSSGESAVEFRRFTESDLRERKVQDATTAENLMRDEQAISLDEAQALLRALNDVRLSLGTRLEVDEDTPYPRKITTDRDQALAIYFWIGGVQEQLLDALMSLDEDV